MTPQQETVTKAKQTSLLLVGDLQDAVAKSEEPALFMLLDDLLVKTIAIRERMRAIATHYGGE